VVLMPIGVLKRDSTYQEVGWLKTFHYNGASNSYAISLQ
jgi:hypothetical protein